MYLVFARGGRVVVGDSGLCCWVCVTSFWRYNYLPCLLILHERSGPRSVSDFSFVFVCFFFVVVVVVVFNQGTSLHWYCHVKSTVSNVRNKSKTDIGN